MSKLSEIEARLPIGPKTGWDGRDSLQAFEDRRYLLGLVREMRKALLAMEERYYNSNADVSRECRFLLAKLEE